MKASARILCNAMFECFYQASGLFSAPAFKCSLVGLAARPFCASAIDKLGEKEEDSVEKGAKKKMCSLDARDVSSIGYRKKPLDQVVAQNDRSTAKQFLQPLSCSAAEKGISVHLPEFVPQIKSGSLRPEFIMSVMELVLNEWELGLRTFLWAKQQLNYKHTTEAYELIVHILGNAKKFDIMWQLLEEFKREGFLFRLKTLEVIFQSYVRAGSIEDSMEAFKRLCRLDDSVGTAALNSLIRVLCMENRKNDCRLVLRRLKEKCPPNEMTYSILIHAFCEGNKLSEALNIFEEMIQNNIQPSLATYSYIIKALSANKQTEFAQKLFDHMKAYVLRKFGRTPEVGEFLTDTGLLDEGPSNFDSKAYDSLIISLSSLGDLDEALELLEEMVKKGFTPSSKTYSSIFSHLCRKRKSREAFELFNIVVATSHFPDLQTLNTLIETFCSTGHVGIAMELWYMMQEKGYGCNRESYCVFIHGLCYNSLFEDAFFYFNEMVQNGIVPLFETYRKLLYGLLRGNNPDMLADLSSIVGELELKGIKLSQPKKSWRKR